MSSGPTPKNEKLQFCYLVKLRIYYGLYYKPEIFIKALGKNLQISAVESDRTMTFVYLNDVLSCLFFMGRSD